MAIPTGYLGGSYLRGDVERHNENDKTHSKHMRVCGLLPPTIAIFILGEYGNRVCHCVFCSNLAPKKRTWHGFCIERWAGRLGVDNVTAQPCDSINTSRKRLRATENK